MPDSNTKLLLHCDGSDAGTTFTDEVSHTFTAFGDAQLDTAQLKFGTASGLFDGTGDYITTPNSTDFDPGTGNFTAEMFVRVNAFTPDPDGASYQIGTVDFYNGSAGWCFVFTATDSIRFYANYSASWAINFGGLHGMSTGTWYHIAVVRNGTALNIYVDGVSKASATSSANITSPNVLAIGRNGVTANYHYNGWIDEVRYSNVARYTANFTPPSAAFNGAAAGGTAAFKSLLGVGN